MAETAFCGAFLPKHYAERRRGAFLGIGETPLTALGHHFHERLMTFASFKATISAP
jgi:hypothetical protein